MRIHREAFLAAGPKPGWARRFEIGKSDMNWSDTRLVGEALFDAHPDVEPTSLRFTDLRDMVMALPGFEGDRDGCNESILEAILQVWMDEAD